MFVNRAFLPIPTLPAPLVFDLRHSCPTAVLECAVFALKELKPIAVQLLPVVFASKALAPTAVFSVPVVFSFNVS